MEIRLKYPLTEGDAKFETITLRRMKSGDVVAVERMREGKGEVEISHEVIALLSGWPVSRVLELDYADFTAIDTAAASFFPKAGAKAAP